MLDIRHYARVADTDALWGGTLQGIQVDVTTRRLDASVRVKDSGVTRDLVLVFEGVSALRLDRAATDAWDYTEITEVHVHEAAGEMHVEMVFWSEPEGLTADCATVRVEPDRA